MHNSHSQHNKASSNNRQTISNDNNDNKSRTRLKNQPLTTSVVLKTVTKNK